MINRGFLATTMDEVQLFAEFRWIVSLCVGLMVVGLVGVPSLHAEAGGAGSDDRQADPSASPQPKRMPFQDEIDHFKKADAKRMPPRGATLFVGSSSVRLWHGRLEKDFSDRPVIGRGFGGSTMNLLLHYFDDIVAPYDPAVIVVYEGDNDLAWHKARAKNVIPRFDKFVRRVRQRLPDAVIVFIPAKPSPARWDRWEQMARLNAHLSGLADEHADIWYADTAAAMLATAEEEGHPPHSRLFRGDGLHLSDEGYDLWAAVVKDTLEQVDASQEEHDAHAASDNNNR